MLNLLSQQEKKNLIREYYIHFTIVIVISICILLIIAVVGLLPSYVTKRAEINAITKKQQEPGEQSTPEALQAAQAQAAANLNLADFLEARTTALARTPLTSSIIGRIFEIAGGDISIEGIDIVNGSITITGIGATRDALISFHKRLRKEQDFKNATLPISDIAKSVDPNFAIRITLP